jgi:class 3 adenylate cyclase/CHASE2 domain-containing sensor protein
VKLELKIPVRLRRLRIFGVAMALSAVASATCVALYLMPPEKLPSMNRIGDFVVVNDGLFAARENPLLAKYAHFPDYDPPNEHLRLITIDEASLKDERDGGLGRIPIPRFVHGRFLDRLAKAGAKVATFDLEFFEHARDPKEDAAFLHGLHAQPSVLGMSLAVTPGGVLGVEKPPSDIERAAAGLGSTTVDNPGGWLVGQPLVISATDPATNKTSLYPSLALRTVSYYLGKPFKPVDDWHATLGDESIPLDGGGKLLMLPFIVEEHIQQASTNGLATRAGATDLSMPSIQMVSYVEALKFDDDTMKAFAQGNIIVVGYTAQAAGDFIVTPNGRYPGVFSNVRLMDQLMTGRFIHRVPPAVDLALIVILPFIIGFIVTQLPATAGVALALVIATAYGIFAIAYYAYTLHWINLIHVSGAVILAALFVALYRTITEGADKRVIREMFGKHVSPAIVDSMMNHDDPLKALDLSGKNAKVTIFYSDIRGFTAMSEKMTPAEVYANLNTYFQAMCDIVFAHGGYVDKFIGDCLMAVFSAPDPRPGDTDAYEATEAALQQQEKITAMMLEWAAEGRQTFNVGMGLNTGEVMMGNLGSSERLNYTVIGDNVNTAARLYNVAKGGQIIISESTYEAVKDRFIVNELAPVSVKGKTLPLRNFEIVGRLKSGEPNTSKLLDPDNMPEVAVHADH